MKQKLLTRWNAFLGVLLGMLGLGGCKPQPEIRALYGCPYVTLDVTGTITDEASKPLKDIEVTVTTQGYPNAPVVSDSDGHYAFHSRDGERDDTLDILVTDPSGRYESDSARVVTEKRMFDQWTSDWQQGEAVAHKDFQLKKK